MESVERINLLGLDGAALSELVGQWGQAVSRPPAAALDAPARRRFVRRHDRPGPRVPGPVGRAAASRPCRSIPSSVRPTARASGCSTWGRATPSRRSSSPKTIAALCISSQAGCGELPFLLDRTPGLQPQPEDQRDHRPAVVGQARARGRYRHGAPGKRQGIRRHPRGQQRRHDGHGRASAQLRPGPPALRLMLDDNAYGRRAAASPCRPRAWFP